MDPQVMTETIKSSFLFNFRTGNLVVDTLITGLIIMCSSYLLNLAQRLTSMDFLAMVRWIRYRSSASIIITGHWREEALASQHHHHRSLERKHYQASIIITGQ